LRKRWRGGGRGEEVEEEEEEKKRRRRFVELEEGRKRRPSS